MFSMLSTKFPIIAAHIDDEEPTVLLHTLANPSVPLMRIAFPDGETWHIRAPIDGRSLVTSFAGCRSRARSSTASLAGMSVYQKQWALCADTSHPDRAIKACSELIESRPRTREDVGRAYHNRCAASIAEGNVASGLADCSQAINLDPAQSSAFVIRCTIYDGRRDYDRAISDCNEAVRLAPGFALAYLARAGVREHLGQSDQANNDLATARRLGSQDRD